jgi:hypothetical protein
MARSGGSVNVAEPKNFLSNTTVISRALDPEVQEDIKRDLRRRICAKLSEVICTFFSSERSRGMVYPPAGLSTCPDM